MPTLLYITYILINYSYILILLHPMDFIYKSAKFDTVSENFLHLALIRSSTLTFGHGKPIEYMQSTPFIVDQDTQNV